MLAESSRGGHKIDLQAHTSGFHTFAKRSISHLVQRGGILKHDLQHIASQYQTGLEVSLVGSGSFARRLDKGHDLEIQIVYIASLVARVTDRVIDWVTVGH